MRTINVVLEKNSYPIVIGNHVLPDLGSWLKKHPMGGDAIVITHPRIQRLCGQTLSESLKENGFGVKVFPVPEGEESKSAKTAFHLIEKIARYDSLKKVFIIALGGGVVGDLAGFVAAVYKRGIPYIQVPTTFLAQIDSAIGGKVAIDLPVGKNLVGAFYQPKVVWSDVSVLASLSERQIRNGLAEAIKYGIIYDQKLFQYLEKNHESLLKGHAQTIMEVVLRCSRIKAEVVHLDEYETKGIRTILNFGHTTGHAIEAAGAFRDYQHGEAVALGMRVAVDISYQLRMVSEENCRRINRILDQMGLPKRIKGLRLSDLMNVMRHDKKFISGKNRFVLVQEIGTVKVVEGVPRQVIQGAVQRLLSS